MPEAQLTNPQGAFGYLNTSSTPPAGTLHSQKIARFRNLSTARGIAVGAGVVFGFTSSTASGVATLSTVDEGVFCTTVIGHRLFAGVAITSAAARTTGSTLGGPAPSSEYCNIVMEGPVWALLDTGNTAPVAGAPLILSNTTVSGGSTVGVGIGGVIGTCDTVLVTSAANAVLGIVGACIVPGTTGTTGQLTTIGNRGLIWVSRSMCLTTRSS